jgi:hypothetical protein
MPADPAATVIPDWAVLFAFTVGAIATLLEIIRFAVYLAKQPHLEVRLTKQVFIRLIEKGECFFCNAVILGRHGPIEIRDAFFVLRRLGESKKTFRLTVTDIGAKTPSAGPIAGLSFYTTSPLEFVVSENTFRPVIVAALEEHRASIRGTFGSFDDKVYEKRDELLQRSPASDADEQSIRQEVGTFLETHVAETVDSICDFVQMEPGTYEIELKVRYVPLRRLFRRQQTASSKVQFEMDRNYRKIFRRQIRNTLLVRGGNILFSKDASYLFPEFEIIDAKEM